MGAQGEDRIYLFPEGPVRIGDMTREQLLRAIETVTRLAASDSHELPALQIGDIVGVRGSNTLMCVEAVENGKALCVWVHKSVCAREAFHIATLHNVTGAERDLRASRDRDRVEMKQRLKERVQHNAGGKRSWSGYMSS